MATMSNNPGRPNKRLEAVLIDDDTEFVTDLSGALTTNEDVECRVINKNLEIRRLLDTLNDAAGLEALLAASNLLLLDIGLTPEDHDIYKQAVVADRGEKKSADLPNLLGKLTGFQVLQAIQAHPILQKNTRVVLISALDEKFLAEQAIRAGAFSFISKYSGVAELIHSGKLKSHRDVVRHKDARLMFRRDALAIQIRHVFEKAEKDLAFESMSSFVPQSVSVWIQREKRRLQESNPIDGTLLLTDIRGSTALQQVTVSKGRTDIFLRVLNVILSDINSVITQCRGETSAFTGDGLLAFFNVYQADQNHVYSALTAAFEIAATFRTKTMTAINEVLKESSRVREIKNEIAECLNNRVGIRTGLVLTDRNQSIAATVGNEQRRQHTVISAQLNMLSRALDAVGGDLKKLIDDGNSVEKYFSRDPVVFVTQDAETSMKMLQDAGYAVSKIDLYPLRDFETQHYALFALSKASK